MNLLTLSLNLFRELPNQVSLLVIDKKTSNKRKKRFTKISSSDKNVVILFSETIKPVNEAEILEAKNNLKNISEHVNVEEIVEENEIEDEAVDQIDSYRKEDPKNGNDFPDNNSEINDTAEVVIEKRLKEVEDEDEVDSHDVVADDAEEEILDEEMFENSDMSYKTASSTASLNSHEEEVSQGNPSSDENELLSLHLPGSVEEMKAIIELRKKKDERIDNKFDLWQKHSIIQAL